MTVIPCPPPTVKDALVGSPLRALRIIESDDRIGCLYDAYLLLGFSSTKARQLAWTDALCEELQ